MPVYLNEIDDFSKLGNYKSVLIVPCRFCPAASLAVSKKAPYFQPLKNLLKTPSYEQYLDTVQTKLEKRGIQTDVFKSYLPHQFVVCMWTGRRRKKLRKVARNYDAVLVMGCEAALDTVQDAIDASFSRVFQGMRTEGIMSIKPLLQAPCNVSLELNRITPLLHDGNNDEAWVRL
jgi:hypothetical protein